METSHDPTTRMEIRTDAEAREKVHTLIRKTKFAMMATYDLAGNAHSRPMVAVAHEGNELWFFTRAESRKMDELKRDPRVLLDYADGGSQTYVSLVGRTRLTTDPEQAKSLWVEPLRTWFPDGPEDPHIALIEVKVESVEYWDAPSSAMVHAYGYLRARITGKPPELGEIAHVPM